MEQTAAMRFPLEIVLGLVYQLLAIARAQGQEAAIPQLEVIVQDALQRLTALNEDPDVHRSLH
jgi:hypothetical protein